MAASHEVPSLAAEVKLRRPDLYNAEPSACWWCATHIDVRAVFDHPVVARWLGPYAQWKAVKPQHQNDPSPVAQVNRRSWQAVHRWLTGAAPDFNVVDSLLCQIGYPMRPNDFEGAYLRRKNFPWDPNQYATRVAYVWALKQAERILEGKPLLQEDASAEVHPGVHVQLGSHQDQRTRCPGCGSYCGPDRSLGLSPAERHALARRIRVRSARGRTFLGAPSGDTYGQLALFGGVASVGGVR